MRASASTVVDALLVSPSARATSRRTRPHRRASAESAVSTDGNSHTDPASAIHQRTALPSSEPPSAANANAPARGKSANATPSGHSLR